MLLGPAETATSPPTMTAKVPDRNAEAPLVTGGTTKVIMPPFTGSTGLFAVTVTASGCTNAAPMADDCGVLPATGREREALALEGADVRAGRVERKAALVGGDARDRDADAQGGAAGEQGDRFGRTAIAAQGPQPRVSHAHKVAVNPIHQPTRAARSDQVIRARNLADDI